jgi:hypothetical protein
VETTNDNDYPAARVGRAAPDPYGQAAMLLVESLLHGLVARSVLSTEHAIEIVEVAAEVKADIAADLGDTPAQLRQSLDLLAELSASLALDRHS